MNLNELIENASVIGISGHVHPDGDCVGSTLGLCEYIRTNYPEVEVSVYLEEIPKVFSFMAGADDIIHVPDEKKHFDLYFALDCGDTLRLGAFANQFLNADVTVCIDHHKSNQGMASHNYIVPDASSTCELVYDLLDLTKVTKEVAECLYTGLVHDTGVFQYSCTSAKTMNIAGVLMEQGIDYSRLIDETYYEKTFEQNKILAKAVTKAKLYSNGKIISSCITKADMEECKVSTKDLDGIVNQLRITKGVEVAVFLYECGEQEFKVSMRSKKVVDVADIAVKYGGGGHARAAGVTMSGDENTITETVINAIKEKMEP